MPFEPAPKITTNPWTEQQPREARALADLAKHLRTPEVARAWDFSEVWCGTAGCALGHAPDVPACYELGITHSVVRNGDDIFVGCYINLWDVWKLPKSRHGRSYGTVANAFFSCPSYSRPSQVTPAMVADRIDHWLATGEIV